ncbi:EAL domain-containing protein [Sulfurospirillum sp. T05]|uniref:EAL domain-containing protein n=1 Tax=Sulfurospirillum tamanense TaxID=2813362 RepID=A0ABS2WRR8_9BACT|nr:EAL domain-containing protein [Sulfurospirillum tamanensis]MBN2964295.1 EAL domain-containing protein [Sulfurospirillum tamanensis]
MLNKLLKNRQWGLKRILLFSMLPVFLLTAATGVLFNYFAAKESAQNLLRDYVEHRSMELKFIANLPTLKIFIMNLRLGLEEEAAFFRVELEDSLEQFFNAPDTPAIHHFTVVSQSGQELLRVVNGKVTPTFQESVNLNFLHTPSKPYDASDFKLSSHTDSLKLLDPINNELIGGLIYEYHIPIKQILAKPRQVLWFNLLFSFVGIAMLFFLFYLIIDFNIQPLKRLSVAVRRIIDGNLDQKIDAVGFGETLALSESFEQMRGRLKASFVEISNKNDTLATLLEEQRRISIQMGEKNQELEASKAQLAQSEEKLATTLHSIGDGVIATDEKGLVSSMNPMAEKLCGWTLKEAQGRPLDEVFIIINARTRKPCLNPVGKVLDSGEVVGLANHTVLLAKDGNEYQIADSAAPIRNRKGEITGVVLVISDVTEKYAQEEKLRQAQEELTKNLESQLYTDELTRLGSRASLLKEIKASTHPAVILIDINSFRTINELYGVEVGSEVLVLFSLHLKEFATLKKYQAYRISGDEFVLFRDTAKVNVSLCNSFLIELFRFIKKTPISPSLLNEDLYLDISAGVSFEPINPLETANIALNNAKQHYSPYAIFSKEMDSHEEITYGALWKKKIILGLQRSAFVPFFQPIVDKQQRVVKYEALMRFRESEEENTAYIPPHEFLDIAIKTRHYNKVSQITLLKSLSTCVNANITVSLNLSYQDILNRDLHKILRKTIEKNAIGGRVVFEIVESQNIKDYDILKAFVREFKALGVRFAIDDFGTGFSNFTHIFELSPDFIKIDGSLIKHIDSDKKSLELVKAIVFFSKEMGIKTIAEFVHSEEIFKTGLKLGIDFFQGYYFGKPCPWEN